MVAFETTLQGSYALVITASPIWIGASASQAFCSLSAPAALNIAPHTPPPILSDVLAALTMASTFIFVMSLRMIVSGIVFVLIEEDD